LGGVKIKDLVPPPPDPSNPDPETEATAQDIYGSLLAKFGSIRDDATRLKLKSDFVRTLVEKVTTPKGQLAPKKTVVTTVLDATNSLGKLHGVKKTKETDVDKFITDELNKP